MSTFGYGVPVIKVGATEYDLDYCVIETCEPQSFDIEKIAVDGTRELKKRGTHYLIELKYYLWKQGTLSQQHTRADLLQDLLWNDTSFKFKRHKTDGAYYKDASLNEVNFALIEFNPYPFTKTDYKDAVYLKIISLTCVRPKATIQD